MERHFTECPCAAAGLISYRYAGMFGWLMIGARDNSDALREAARSISPSETSTIDKLQIWNSATGTYVPATN